MERPHPEAPCHAGQRGREHGAVELFHEERRRDDEGDGAEAPG